MRRKISMALVMALVLSLAGCAETPEESVVVQKDQEQLIATANSLADGSLTIADQVQAPETVRESDTEGDGLVTIEMDAEVTLPEADAAKIIRVTQHEFTQEEVDGWTEVLFGDQTLYDPDTYGKKTKSELEAQLLEYQKELAELEADGEDEEDEEVETEVDEEGNITISGIFTRKDELRDIISSIEKQIETAAEEQEPTETTNELVDGWASFCAPDEEGDGAMVMTVHNEPGVGLLSWLKSKNWNFVTNLGSTHNYYLCDSLERWASFDETVGEYITLPEPELTREEAEALGEAFVESLRIDGMELVRAEKMVLAASDYFGDEPAFDALKGWRLTYFRSVDGIPVSDTDTEASFSDDSVFWSYERLTLFVTDDGVVECAYEAPYDLGETLAENCKLLDFDSILNIFKKMAVIQFSDAYGGGDWYGVCSVSGIRFGYTRITESGGSFSGLLVPTWTFYGQWDWFDSSGAETDSWSRTDSVTDIMTINAIDGSVIDRDMGY